MQTLISDTSLLNLDFLYLLGYGPNLAHDNQIINFSIFFTLHFRFSQKNSNFFYHIGFCFVRTSSGGHFGVETLELGKSLILVIKTYLLHPFYFEGCVDLKFGLHNQKALGNASPMVVQSTKLDT